MKITADFTRLHSGENLSKRIRFAVDEEFRGKRAKLGFITPKGHIYFTEELPYENGEGEYIIPAFLPDGKGVLLSQLFLWDENEFLGKSPVTEIPVYLSVDDIDCPETGEEAKKSLALIFEYLEMKADKDHSHDDRYYTKEHIDSVLENVQTGSHNHDGRYYTKEQTTQLVAEKVQGSVDFTLGVAKDIYSAVNGKSDTGHTHDDRYYTVQQTDTRLNAKSDKEHNHDSAYYTREELDERFEGVGSAEHNHDSRYYTEEETDSLLEGKSDSTHSHGSLYYTKADVDTALAGKSGTDHAHDGRYYTREQTGNLLSEKADISYVEAVVENADSVIEGIAQGLSSKADAEHNHDSRYYTESETKALLSVKADSSYVEGVVSEAGSAIDRLFSGLSAKADKNDVLHTVRIPSFNEIDNSVFAGRLRECASSWISASEAGDVCYGSLSVDTTDFMAERLNPMLYATRYKGSFTESYRNIFYEAGINSKDSEGKGRTVNCITLCNMLIMGVPYKASRLCGHENVIGMSGYAFDICPLLGNSIKGNNRELTFNDTQKLGIETFRSILTQTSFFEAYDGLGLVKTLKAKESASSGDIWYSALRPGDVLWTGSHSMLCLSVTAESGKVTIGGVHASTADNISSFNFTVTSDGAIDGISYTSMLKVARPYLTYTVPEASATEFGKQLKGPFIGIGKDTDLNSVLSVGEYRCVSTTNVKSLKHKPTDLADTFRLTVENLTKDEETLSKTNDFLQTLVSSKGEIYTRIITTYNYSPSSPYIYPWRKHSMKNHTVTALADNDDLNSFTKTGEYRCASYTTARTIKNRPSGLEQPFRMIIDNTLGDTFTVQSGTFFTQRIREVSGREFWRRIFWENGAPDFGDWHKVLTETVETVSE